MPLFEKILSVLLTLAALSVAIVVVKREFAPSESRAAAPVTPEFVEGWEGLVGTGKILGNQNAPLRLIEFADMECPFCARYHATLRAVRERHPDALSFQFMHFPLPNHSSAVPAGRAVECAFEQNRLDQMLEAIYAKQDSLKTKSWAAFATEAGVADSSKFARCISDPASQSAVERDKAVGDGMAVRGTPTVLLQGWKFGSPPSGETLDDAIGRLLAGRRPF